MNISRFISRRNYQDLKSFCFVFRNGCLLLVREESNKKNQVIYRDKIVVEESTLSVVTWE
jgi:hypothetical protein